MAVYYDILAAVRDLVAALPGLDGAGQVVVRKKPAYIPSFDTVLTPTTPLVCVCPTAEILDDMVFPNQDFLLYPVQVALIQEGRLLLADTAAMRAFFDHRQAVRRALRVTALAGVSAVFDVVGYNPDPVFDRAALDANFDVSVQEFVYRAAEPRSE